MLLDVVQSFMESHKVSVLGKNMALNIYIVMSRSSLMNCIQQSALSLTCVHQGPKLLLHFSLFV